MLLCWFVRGIGWQAADFGKGLAKLAHRAGERVRQGGNGLDEGADTVGRVDALLAEADALNAGPTAEDERVFVHDVELTGQ